MMNAAPSSTTFTTSATPTTTGTIEAASRFAREKAAGLRARAEEGDRSLRFLALIGGLGCVVVGLFELSTRIMRLRQPVGAVIDVYVILLGCLVVVLESGGSGGDNVLFLPKGFLHNLNKYALFLRFLWGRGSLYFVCGTLQLTQIDLFNLVAGGYMCAVGILYVVVGNNTAKKLRAIRKSLYSEYTLQTKFAAAAATASATANGDGGDGDGLDIKQFRSLCEDLGLDLTGREVEATFGCIQKNGNENNNETENGGEKEKLSYREFKAWWDDLEGDGQINDNAFVFV